MKAIRAVRSVRRGSAIREWRSASTGTAVDHRAGRVAAKIVDRDAIERGERLGNPRAPEVDPDRERARAEPARVEERTEAGLIGYGGDHDVDSGERVAGVARHPAGGPGRLRPCAERLRALAPAAERDDALDGQLRCERVEVTRRLHPAPDKADGPRIGTSEPPGGDKGDGGGAHRGDVLGVEDRDRHAALAVVHHDDPADVRETTRRVRGRDADRLEHCERRLASGAQQREGEPTVSGCDAFELRSFPGAISPAARRDR